MSIKQLKQEISDRFNLSDLRTICFEMGIDFEEVGTGSKSEVITNLLTFCQRRDRLADLQAAFQGERPFVDWASLFASLENAPLESPNPGESGKTLAVEKDAYGVIQDNKGQVTQNFNFGTSTTSNDQKAAEAYQKAKRLMPAFLTAVKQDLTQSPTFREFILKEKEVIADSAGRPLVSYAFETYADLQNKVHILENMGFVKDVSFNKVPRYRLQEDFVDQLLADNDF